MSRQIIIGDIHGCYDELMEILDRIGPGPEDRIISLGDLVDRGLDSVKVYRFFRETPNTVSLVGNHERKHIRQTMSYAQEISRLQFGEDYASALGWMSGLPYFFDGEHATVVHAALVPGIPLEEQKEEILCGSISGEKALDRIFPDRNWYEAYSGAKPVVFGHKVVGDAPLVWKDKIYGLDTGACHGGFLSALTVPDFKLYSVRAREDYWNINKRRWQEPILRNKPWESMKWEKIHQEMGRYQRVQNAPVKQFVSNLTAWRADLDDLISRMADEIARFVEESIGEHGEQGFREIARSHPLKPLLFQSLSRKMTAADLYRKFQTPADLLDAVSHLSEELHAEGKASHRKWLASDDGRPD